jgi:hypothetical protein
MRWNFDGEADVKAAVAMKIGATAVGRCQKAQVRFRATLIQCWGLVCDATAGSRGGMVLVVFADRRKT